MKQLKVFIFLFLFIGVSITSQAQIWKKIKNKVQKKAEEKINKEADKIIDKTIDGTKKERVDLQRIYKFNQSVIIEFSADEGDKAVLELLFSSNNKDIVCMTLDSEKSEGRGGEVYNVITSKSSTMFMNMSGMKIKKTMPNEQFSKFDNSKKIPTKKDLVKTGNMKSILGFLCHEYKYENDGGIISAWVTKENFPIDGKFIPMLGMKNSGPFEGFVMELIFKSTNERGSVKVVKINKSRNVTINTKEYKSMGF